MIFAPYGLLNRNPEMNYSGWEKREAARYSTYIPVSINSYLYNKPHFSGQIVDISETGFKLLFSNHGQVNPEIGYDLHIPVQSIFQNEFMPFRGTDLRISFQFKWVKPIVYKFHQAGCLMTEFSATTQNVIKSYLEIVQKQSQSA